MQLNLVPGQEDPEEAARLLTFIDT